MSIFGISLCQSFLYMNHIITTHCNKDKAMALRFLLLLGLFFFLCLSQVSSDEYLEKQEAMTKDEVEAVKEPNKRFMLNIDCGWECKRRCGAHSRPNRCLRACGTCCLRCHCVPPGTSGNREMCGTCYTTMTTHANKTKCP